MSKIVGRLLAIAFLLSSPNAQSQTAQDIASSFLSVAGTGDYETAASYFDEQDLKYFRASIRSLAPNKRFESHMLKPLFGEDVSLENLDSLSDVQFFSAFLQIWLEADDDFALDIGDFKIIGEVREDNGLVHVLTRHKFHIGDEAFETTSVTHVIDSGNSPKIAMPPEISAIAAIFRRTLDQ